VFRPVLGKRFVSPERRKVVLQLAFAEHASDPEHVSTSYVERQNLTMRMSMRRFTRLTNGFSKKLDNHCYMVDLYFMHYNFCRVHKTLRVTPAMQAGLTDHVWTIEELCNLLPEPKAAKSTIEKELLLKALTKIEVKTI
jgi:hypothetical protein